MGRIVRRKRWTGIAGLGVGVFALVGLLIAGPGTGAALQDLTPTTTPDAGATGSAILPMLAPGSPTPLPTNTLRPTLEPVSASTTTPIPGALFDETGEIRDHYWLDRPFPRDPSGAIQDYAARNYPYGSTANGQFNTHHGMDFQNPFGTRILAAASGWVVYAGDDLQVIFGPQPDFYGNLVVIQHDFTAPGGELVYTLYGHMSRLDVQAGQRVEAGQAIGQVGATGVALGSHLHLEVRLGDPLDYYSTYNPDLWLKPWARSGVVAGRITDRDGNRLYDTPIILQRGTGPSRTAYSYADDGVNPDPYYGEHFAIGDLSAGEYQVLVRIKDVLRFKGTVTVVPGQTAWIDIRLN